jgi:hypothetical protein
LAVGQRGGTTLGAVTSAAAVSWLRPKLRWDRAALTADPVTNPLAMS